RMVQIGLKRFSTTALVARVVDTDTNVTFSRCTPPGSASSTARSAPPRPSERSQWVVSDLALARTVRRAASRATASVKVPPVSSPSQISRALMLSVKICSRGIPLDHLRGYLESPAPRDAGCEPPSVREL